MKEHEQQINRLGRISRFSGGMPFLLFLFGLLFASSISGTETWQDIPPLEKREEKKTIQQSFEVASTGKFSVNGVEFEVCHYDRNWQRSSQNDNNNRKTIHQKQCPDGKIVHEGIFHTKTGNFSFLSEIKQPNQNWLDWQCQVAAEPGIDTSQLVLEFRLPVAIYDGMGMKLDEKFYSLSTGGKGGNLYSLKGTKLMLPGEDKTITITGTIRLHVSVNYNTPKPMFLGRLYFSRSAGVITQSRQNFRFETIPCQFKDFRNLKPDVSRQAAVPFSISGSDKEYAAIQWKPQSVESGSALDLSWTLNAPAGKHGRVVCRNGQFEFESRPGEKARFFGTNICNLALFPSPEQSEKLAAMLAQTGYNAVRFHHFDHRLSSPGSGKIDNEENYKKFAYLMDALRRRGIYYTMDMWSQRRIYKGMEGREKFSVPLRMALEPETMENVMSFALELLQRKNPFNGMALKNDPAFLPFNIINENTFVIKLDSFPELREKFLVQSRDFQKESKLDENNRIGQYIFQRQKETYLEMKKFFADSGINIATSDTNYRIMIALSAHRNLLDYVDNHSYWAHYPYWSTKNPSQNQRPPSSAWFAYPLCKAPTRIFGKPFACTESQIFYMNPYRMQFGPLAAMASGLQGWDLFLRYSYSHCLDRIDHPMPAERLNSGSDPMALFSDRLAVLAYRKGAIKPASVKIPYVVTSEYLKKIMAPDGGPLYPMSYRQLGLFAQIGTVVADQDMSVLQDSLFIVVPADMEIPEYLSQYKTERDSGNLLNRLKDYSIPSETGWDNKTLVSSCGQVIYNIDKSLIIKTPTIEILTLQEREEAIRGKVAQIGGNASPVVFALASLDGKPLGNSTRQLLLYLTDLRNSGIILDGDTIVSPGELPLLVKKDSAQVTLFLDRNELPDVWALRWDGKRIQKIPVKMDDKKVTFQVYSYTDENCYYAYELIYPSDYK